MHLRQKGIIDMQLPDGTGFDVSEIFKNNATSVIFLTVVDDENTIVRAFDEGAQDYIVKPFRIRELLARVRRILSVNIKNGEKDNIIYMGPADGNFVEDNTLTVYVKRLREKLGEAIHIETVRGMGYRVD